MMAAQLDTGILGDGVGNTSGDQGERAVVIAVAQVRNHPATEAADLAVGQDGLEAVTHGHVVLAILF